MRAQGCENNDMKTEAREQQGQNAAREALGQHCHSSLGEWVQSCYGQTGRRAACERPLMLQKAEPPTCNS